MAALVVASGEMETYRTSSQLTGWTVVHRDCLRASPVGQSLSPVRLGGPGVLDYGTSGPKDGRTAGKVL